MMQTNVSFHINFLKVEHFFVFILNINKEVHIEELN